MKEIQLYRGLLGGHSGKTKLESRLELRWEVEYMDVWGQAVGAGGGGRLRMRTTSSSRTGPKKPSSAGTQEYVCAFTVLTSMCTTPLLPAFLSIIPSRPRPQQMHKACIPAWNMHMNYVLKGRTNFQDVCVEMRPRKNVFQDFLYVTHHLIMSPLSDLGNI